MTTAAQTADGNAMSDVLRKLHSIKLGSGGPRKVRSRELAYMMHTLSTLVGNGVSLPKAVRALSQEHALRAHAEMLQGIHRKLESGESLHAAAAEYPTTFDELTVHQLRIGERSGTIPQTLDRIAEQLAGANRLRRQIIKRLSYPGIVLIAGTGVIAFMLMFVVPVFQETYRKANVPLPGITQALVAVSNMVMQYGWIGLSAAAAAFLVWRWSRRQAAVAHRMDHLLLHIPLIGPWLRDIAVLQFMNVFATMLASGFKVVDALAASAGSVGNWAVRQAVGELQAAVVRGERLSRELERQEELFPPVVSQLVIVGEQTGKLAETSRQVVGQMEDRIRQRTDIVVGAIEPVLTIGMAASIGGLLLAIYLPIFDMINVVAK